VEKVSAVALMADDDCYNLALMILWYIMVTIREIARLTGVSRGTVDRVINKRGNVNPATEKKITDLLQKMQYKPNRNARALSVQKRKFKIGYIYSASDINEFFIDVISGMDAKVKELEEYHITLVKKNTRLVDISNYLQAMDEMRKKKIDGLIMTPIRGEEITQKINELVGRGIPVITCNVDIAGSRRFAFVGCDLYKSGFIAGGLISIIAGNYASIGIITKDTNFGRIGGLTDAVQQGYPNVHIASVAEVIGEKDSKTYSCTKEMMKKNPEIKAIFSENVAISGVCRALKDLKLDKQVKVICFDETPIIKRLLLEGRVHAIVFQNPFWQGYRSIEVLWDYLLSRKMPENELNFSLNEIHIRESILDRRLSGSLQS
jgi:LacI family transcriptional regulator